jgi:signal transduction histidine kinase
MHKALQLENMTKQLRKKAAENKYIKRAAMGYIEKKEYELEQVRKDLQNRIDNLRRTQKAMFYMIEDLNSMSAQLKDARDHLEEKVRKRSEELLHINRKLHRSERLAFLGKLAGSVTHELRNPLAVLKNAVFFLKNKLAGIKDEKVGHYVEVMEKEIMLIDHIIEDIMGFARTRPVNPEKTDLRYMVENLCGELDLPDEITVVKELNDVPEVKVDPRQVTHALVNIANNAIIAMNGKGKLTLRTYHSGDGVCAEIKDDGPGIPEKEQDLIFEPLYSSKPKGTGLGLPISKMMIENNNGCIDFESETGVGTVFRVCFPVVP